MRIRTAVRRRESGERSDCFDFSRTDSSFEAFLSNRRSGRNAAREPRKVKTGRAESPAMAAASAPGKLILFGEHAVVFGEPALSTAIDLRTEVYARPHTEWLFGGAGRPPGGGLGGGGSLDSPKYRYVKAATARAWSGGPLWYEIRSMIPVGSGLGSSAAVTVAALGALKVLRGDFDPLTIAREAFEIEHEVQGRASPLDTSTATAGGGILVRREPGEDLLWTIRRDAREWNLHQCRLPALALVVGDTGISAPTGPLVAGVKERVDK